LLKILVPQNERRKKKSGAAASHIKLAEKLLAAQMRREALKHAKGSQCAYKFGLGAYVLSSTQLADPQKGRAKYLLDL